MYLPASHKDALGTQVRPYRAATQGEAVIATAGLLFYYY
eukprot:SAG31_NODE_522_length_14623_cov_6.071674_13_plen_39_part_00